MSHTRHAHTDFAQDGTLTTPKQPTGAALLSFILPAIVIVMLAGCGNDNKAPAAGSDGPDAAAVASRIAPVAKVAIKAGSSPSTTPAGAGEAAPTAASAPVAAEAAPVEAPAAAPAAVATAAPAGAAPDLYTQACSVCHAAGIESLPVRLTLPPDAADSHRGRTSPITFEIQPLDGDADAITREKSTFFVPR